MCGQALTRPVQRLAALPERVEAQYPNYHPTVPVGSWALDTEPPSSISSKVVHGGWPVLNPDDLLDLPAYPQGRNSGCCGRDGLDGPNVVCPVCGGEVATVRDDCWTYVEARLEPQAVTYEPVVPIHR